MAYLGVTPTTSTQSLVKQDFSVSATQNYTLSQSVTSANDIALYINNVRQEPTYAYSASGTSLTLTAATAGSDDMYCVYLGRAVGTINPASGSVGLGELSATGTKNSTTFLRGDNSFAVTGGGKLFQLVNVHNNDYATYSNTNVDSKVQVLTASITPSATSSKILITGFISMSSTKSSIGHLLGAAGAVEAIFSILTIENNIIPATINLDDLSIDTKLDLVPHMSKEKNVDVVLSNSFGFGGTNASVIFSRYDEN